MQRYSDEPFAIVGVNTDEDRKKYRRMAQELGVTWRSAWQGSPEGPITSQWRVRGFPTIHVLDADGRIRYMNVRGDRLEAAVEKLVAEQRQGGGSGDEGSDDTGRPGG